jgi:hypothetical protein
VPEPDDQVDHDWPEGGGAPFDTAPDETRWVLFARGRFGRTWPAGDALDFGSSTTDFARRVPLGYTTIQVVERLAVVDRGTVLREWPLSGPRVDVEVRVLDPYQRHVPGFEPDPTFEVLDGRGSRRGPDGAWIHHRHDSYDAAIAHARTMTDRRVLVVRLIEEKGWH